MCSALATLTSQPIAIDTGAAGAWQKIQKLKTTASVLHGTAHPDDEQGGVLAKLSRGDGARVLLLTLTRGESGDNAIGPQLFDALGLIRTDELLTADRYYGVDEQDFSTMIDYGFSKRLDETTEKWGLDNAFRDVVRVIRMARPWIVLSRFQGNARDGHGNHSAAGLLSQQASEAAGDPTRFPEQIVEGLRPWSPLKVYMGGVRADENWTVRIDSGEYNPVLGIPTRTSQALASALSGRRTVATLRPPGQTTRTDTRTASRVAAPDRETSIFDGIDTSYAGLFKTLGLTAPAGVASALAAIDAAVVRAVSTFKFTDPASAVPALTEGLRLTREVMAKSGDEPEVLHVLRVKERQFQDAISAALGVELSAFRRSSPKPPAADSAGRGGGRGNVSTMTAPIPGQTSASTCVSRIAGDDPGPARERPDDANARLHAHSCERTSVNRWGAAVGNVFLCDQGDRRRTDQYEAGTSAAPRSLRIATRCQILRSLDGRSIRRHWSHSRITPSTASRFRRWTLSNAASRMCRMASSFAKSGPCRGSP